MSAGPAHRFASATDYGRLVTIEGPVSREDWANTDTRAVCSDLEAGHIVYLPLSPIEVSEKDRAVLLNYRQSGSGYHKNIAYRPLEDRVTGLERERAPEGESLRRILREYSRRSIEFLSYFLAAYANQWKLEFASFRPIEEKGRPGRLHARNDLLHFDSFPTRPTNGARILRFFANINPREDRVWLTSQTFEAFAPRLLKSRGFDSALRKPVRQGVLSLAKVLRLRKANSSAYDDLMHHCHNAMKEDADFQETALKNRWEFPPNSAWIVFTDGVSHAVLSGQYALEQTLLIPPTALVEPRRSPLTVLETLTHRRLTI